MSKPKTEITSQIIIEPAKVNPYLERWSSWNAVFILSATIVSFYYQNLIPLTLISFFTFSSLVYFAKRTKPAIPILTPANVLTGGRFLAVLVLASSFDHLENYLIAGIGLLILIADGIDGKLARSSGKVSEFGEYFDKETDALFLHVLAFTAILKHLIWPWVVILGLLRYLFALFLYFNPKGVRKERRSWIGRYIFVMVVLVLLFLFILPREFSEPAVTLASILLIYSFGNDFIWILTKR